MLQVIAGVPLSAIVAARRRLCPLLVTVAPSAGVVMVTLGTGLVMLTLSSTASVKRVLSPEHAARPTSALVPIATFAEPTRFHATPSGEVNAPNAVPRRVIRSQGLSFMSRGVWVLTAVPFVEPRVVKSAN